MSIDLRAGLTELAERVRQNPMLELLAFEVGEPVEQARFAAAQERLGTEIPPAVQQFYSAVGSAVLRWRFRPDLDEQTLARVRQAFDDTVTSTVIFEAAGAIEIVPLEDLLFDEELTLPQVGLDDKDFDFGDQNYSIDEFSAFLRPFDVVSDFFAMAFVVRPGAAEWPLMWLGDYWAEIDSSRLVPLDVYLKYVLDTWGLINARAELFSEHRGDRQPPMTYEPARAAASMPSILTDPS